MNKTIVIKCGGSVINSITEATMLTKNIQLLQQAGAKVIVVHGGGPEINKLAQLHAVASEFVNGMRVTSAELIDVVHMALIGTNNTKLVQQLNQAGINALGLSGHDVKLLRADYLDFATYGYVGEVNQVNTQLLQLLLANDLLPVIAPLAIDNAGKSLNVNADLVASSIAAALKADALILLSDIDGYYANYPDKTSVVKQLTSSEIFKLFATDGAVASGMLPKLQACNNAVTNGVTHAYVINGTSDYQLVELINNPGSHGTTVVKE